jgi:hypothetical protein
MYLLSKETWVAAKQKNKKQIWTVRVVSAPGYISFLIAWTSLLGVLALAVAPRILTGASNSSVAPIEVPATSVDSSGSLLGYVLFVVVFLLLWSFLVSQTAKLFLWIQTKLSLKEPQVLSCKLGTVAAGWLVFAPLFHYLLSGFGGPIIWLTSALMIAIGVISFTIEHQLSQTFKLKQKQVW